MKVHVSPWDAIEIPSVPLPKKRRRNNQGLFLAARFLHNHRSSTISQELEDFKPTVIVTSLHHVAILGKTCSDALTEHADLVYTSRKDFLFDEKPIPAIYQPKGDRIFALQNGNKAILCWSASKGPEHGQLLSLDSPAESLAPVGSTTGGTLVAHGTCSDGRIFLVNDEMKLSYCAATRVSGTIIATIVRPTTKPDTQIEIYQLLLSEQRTILVHRRVVRVNMTQPLQDQCLHDELVTLHLEESFTDCMDAGYCEDTNMIGIYGQSTGCSGNTTHLISLVALSELSAAIVQHQLPDTTQHVRMVGPNHLAVGTMNEIMIFDTKYGAQVESVSLPQYDNDIGYELVSDPQQSIIGILHSQDKVTSFAIGSSDFFKRLSQFGKNTNLATRLTTALESEFDRVPGIRPVRQAMPLTLAYEELNESKRCAPLPDPHLKKLLHQCNEMIQSRTSRCEEALCLLKEMRAILSNDGPSSIPKNSCMPNDSAMLKNGVKQNPNKKRKGINGAHIHGSEHNGNGTSGDEPDNECCELVHHAIICCIHLMVLRPEDIPEAVRNECLALWKWLVQSKKVSARMHFSSQYGSNVSLETILNSLLSINSDNYNPLEFLLDLFSFCTDLSERNMVEAIHFMLTRMPPVSVAQFLKTSKDAYTRERCQAFMAEIEKKDNESVDDGKGIKVIKLGVLLLFQHILDFSDVNGSLLRTALYDVLSHQERKVLASIIVQAISNPISSNVMNSRNGVHCTIKTVNHSLRAIRWLSSLCDCYRYDLDEPNHVDVSFLERRILTEIFRTETMLSLRDLLLANEDDADDRKVAGKSRSSATTKGAASAAQEKRNSHGVNHVAPYQIEKLIF